MGFVQMESREKRRLKGLQIAQLGPISLVASLQLLFAIPHLFFVCGH